MGKRRERRLAAMMAAGRRVKLDLFTEPSGEMVGSSLHEVGGDLNKDHHAGVPSSPSSSGQKQENPLLLLEQYSDDELDEEASKQPMQITEESLSIDHEGEVGEVQGSVDAGGTVGSKPDNEDATGDIKDDDQLDNINNADSNDTKESDVALAATQYSEADPASQTILDASGMQIVGDLSGSWKVVMDEQSNQYYYWNTVTGDTSWEAPNGLALEVPTTSGVNLSLTVEGQVDYPVLLQANIPATGVHGISNPITAGMEAYGTLETDKGDGKQSSNAFLDYSSSSVEDLASYGAKHAIKTTECYEITDVHSAPLVKYGQNLLQRLKALKGCLDGHEWIVKEIEFRIADCKALSSYGSSLLPFWCHTETQLKLLESVISRAEVSRAAEKSILQNIAGSEVVEKNNTSANGENHYSIPSTDVTVVQIEPIKQMPESEDTVIKGFSSGSTSKGLRAEKDDEAVHSASKIELHTEDVDMDVEMEVDDEAVAVHTTAPCSSTTEFPAPGEPIVQKNPSSVACPPVPLDEPNIPPPPDEEWIPPPPPDCEMIPPPPTEDPPMPSYPPPYADAMPPSFPDQYSLGYALPSYDYYAPAVSEATSLNYYVQADGSHIAEPQQASYYEPVVSSVYSEVAAHVNPVELITYYGISGGSVPHAPVVAGTGSSGFYVESVPVSYTDNISVLDHARSDGYTMESANNSLPLVNHDSDVSAIAKEPDKGSLQAGSNVSVNQHASNALVNGNTTKTAPSAANKNKSKALRSKKCTVAVAPSLRSNKKVSSLVDKWKTAKEELHGDEDEELEDAVEILEKKRQKQIEEWHAHQIASGEAQVNANFLPLGGDWRERVKRRRAEAKNEPGETVSEAVENEKKQPDLVELSKDLPSGWQAYWDESSKEVYYGNSITSETTWTRPTR